MMIKQVLPSVITDILQELPPYFLYGIYTGFIGIVYFFYVAQYLLIPFFTTKEFQQRVSKLSPKEKAYFYVTIPSMIHSIAHSVFHPGWIFFGYSEPHNNGRTIYFDDTWPTFFQGIFVGYLLGDLLVVLGPNYLGYVYCIHHISASSQWIYSTYYESMQYYGSMMQFCEFSTIFLNLRQWILTAGYKSNSKLAMISSGLFFLSFFVVRVVPLPWIIYNWITKDYDELQQSKGIGIAIANTITIGINVLLQTTWFVMMVSKVIKMVTVVPENGNNNASSGSGKSSSNGSECNVINGDESENGGESESNNKRKDD